MDETCKYSNLDSPDSLLDPTKLKIATDKCNNELINDIADTEACQKFIK